MKVIDAITQALRLTAATPDDHLSLVCTVAYAGLGNLSASQDSAKEMPVMQAGRLVGSVNESRLYSALVKDPSIRTQPVETIMQQAFPFADISTGIDALASMLTSENPAVLVRDFKSDEIYVITRSDIVRALAWSG